MNREDFDHYIIPCIAAARGSLQKRWEFWTIDPNRLEVHETLGGLMARQVSLFVQMASNPGVWTGHIGPLILRAMVDVYINLSWICANPTERARDFIYYGLGQEKLHLEHFKLALSENGEDPEENEAVKALTTWIDSQRWHFLTDVNVGSWSGKSTRAMASEADCLDIYNHAYQPFSAAVHSMWNHIAKYNLEHCKNPLHKYHRIPVDPELYLDLDYVYNSAKYLQKTFSNLDEHLGYNQDGHSFFDIVRDNLRELGKNVRSEEFPD